MNEPRKPYTPRESQHEVSKEEIEIIDSQEITKELLVNLLAKIDNGMKLYFEHNHEKSYDDCYSCENSYKIECKQLDHNALYVAKKEYEQQMAIYEKEMKKFLAFKKEKDKENRELAKNNRYQQYLQMKKEFGE